MCLPCLSAGQFPWVFTLMKYAFLRSTSGKAVTYVREAALDLVKARRQSGNAEKVCLLLATDLVSLKWSCSK